MVDIASFTDDQKKFLSHLVSDFGAHTSTGKLLYIIERLLDSLRPGWNLGTFSSEPQLQRDLAVCLAALQYLKEALDE